MAERAPGEILYCCPGIPGHSAPHVFMAGYWLRWRGHNVRVVCRGSGGTEAVDSPLGVVPHVTLGGGTPGFVRGLWLELLKRRRSPGVIYLLHGHVTAPAATLGLWGVPRRRVIYQTEDFLEPGRHRMWEFFERRVARRAGWVISNESNRARFMASHYGLGRMPAVVPTFLPRAWPKPARDPDLRGALLGRVDRRDSSHSRLVMHEGPFNPLRCGPALVEAFRELPADYVLVFTGMNPDAPATAELRRVGDALGLTRRIIALEEMAFDKLLCHTAACDLGALLYRNDGIGNFYQAPGRLTHYLGCGLPMVASNFPGLELLFMKQELGEVCDPTSPGAIAAAIQKLGGQSEDALAAQGRRLRELAATEFAYDGPAEQIEAVIGEARRR